MGGAILLVISLVLAVPLSTNFAHALDLDPAPLEGSHDFPFEPKPNEGPVTVTREYVIRPQDREEFLTLMEQVRLIFLRNGAFLFRVDENLENPETFRTEMFVSSWAEHTWQLARMTKEESEVFQRALGMQVGDEGAAVRHYVKADRMSTSLGCCQNRKGIKAGSGRPIPCGTSCTCSKIAGCRQPRDGVLFDEDLSNNRSKI